MLTLEELYKSMLQRAVDGKDVKAVTNGDLKLMDCLAHPQDKPLVWRVKPCLCPPDQADCADACDWGAFHHEADGVAIDDSKCVGCQACIDACKMDALTTKKILSLSFRNCTTITGLFMHS